MSVVNDYSRSVSFDNVTSETMAVHPTVNFNDINFGYGSSVINNVSDYYNSNNLNNYTYSRNKRKSSTQPQHAPKKSILKNKLSSQQLEYNMNHCNKTINYHDDLDDIIRNYDTLQDQDKSYSMYGQKLKSTSNGTGPVNPSRRKSYSEMTNEELMSLDPQFQNTKSKIDQFKFDSQPTYYRPEKKSVSVPKFEINDTRTKPNLNYKSVNLNYRHEKFKLHRTLLVLIDGRRHTWNSLYYLIKSNFLQHGDHVIIGSLLPKTIDDSGLMLSKCQNLISWFINQIQESLILKITVEFVIDEKPEDSTNESSNPNSELHYKWFINNLFNQYNPNLVLFGNKSSNLNFKYPIKLKKNSHNKFLIRFSSYLIKYSAIPVILVSNNSVCSTSQRKLSVQSIESDSSISTTSSNDKHEPEKDENDKINDPAMINEISNDLKNINYLTFENLIKKVSDKSLNDSKQYLELLNQPSNSQDNLGSVTFNKVSFKDSKISKVNSIYNSNLSRNNSNNSEVYKVKSLLDNSDGLSVNKSVRSESSGNSTGLTTKMIKKKLKEPKKEPKKEPEKKKGFWKRVFS